MLMFSSATTLFTSDVFLRGNCILSKHFYNQATTKNNEQNNTKRIVIQFKQREEITQQSFS